MAQGPRRDTSAGPQRGALALAVALLLVGCAADGDRGEVILDSLAGARSGAEAVYPARSLVEHLPNQHLTVAGETRPSSDYVVLGTVASAELTSSHTIDGDQPVEVEAGSGSALWSMATVVITVERRWGEPGDNPAEAVITVPLRGPATIEEQLDSLRSLGRVVAVVDDGRIVRNEGLLGLVDPAGRITWPLLEDPIEGEGEEFIADIDTVEEIAAAVEEPRPPIVLMTDGSRT